MFYENRNQIEKKKKKSYHIDRKKKEISLVNEEKQLDLRSDAVVILTEWKSFKRLNLSFSNVFDGRNLIKKTFYSIGS